MEKSTASEAETEIALNATITTPKAAAIWSAGWPYHLAGYARNGTVQKIF